MTNPLDIPYEEHPAWGVIGISHVRSSHDNPLFESSLPNHNSVTITIKQAKRKRALNHNWIHGDKLVCKVEMTQAQFAAMICSPNVGDGTPCTLRWRDSVRGEIASPPQDPTPEDMFSQELKDKSKTLATALADALVESEYQLQHPTPPSKAQRKLLVEKIRKAQQEITDGMPYLIRCFEEVMEEQVVKARAEFEASILRTLYDRGLQGFQDDARLLMSNLDDGSVQNVP